MFIQKVPLLPEKCDVIIMCHESVDAQINAEIYQDFQVQKGVLCVWLQYLEQNRPNFHAG
jgi:hypothetical protein